MTINNEQLKSGTNIRFINAVLNREFEEVERFLEIPEISRNLNTEDNGRTVLMYAAERGLEDMVEMLILRGGAEPNYINSYGKTALDYAKSKNNISVERILLQYSAVPSSDLNSKSNAAPVAGNKRLKQKSFSVSPLFQEEQRYLDGTIELINHRLNEVNNLPNAGVDRSTRRALQRHFADSSDNLKNSLQLPYFGRIDFKQEYSQSNESLYIGKFSLVDGNDKLRVINWSTPAGALFYSRKLGRIENHSLGEGEVKLIRNITIRNQEIKDIHDVGEESMFDPLLVSRLQGNAKQQMQDIVETIQEEQDRIIRLPKNTPVIVQGSAGSGKTTVALHRLAYLFHNYPELLPERMIIFGPNQMFMSYIANVLPGLGLEGVEQVSFDDWAVKRLSHSGYRMSRVNPYQAYENPQFFKWCAWRGSMLCKDKLQGLVESYTYDMAPVIGVLAETDMFRFEAGNIELRRWYFEDFKYDKPWTRREKVLKNIKYRFDWYVKQQKRELERTNRDLLPETNISLTKLHEQFDDSYGQLTREWRKINEFEIFFEAFSDFKQMTSLLEGWSEDEITRICDYVKRQSEHRQFSYEDLPALLYIRNALSDGIGVIEKNSPTSAKYQYTVVDEAQDFSPFQLWLISELTVNGGLMILGDLAQAVHAYRGLDNWSQVQELFDGVCDLCMLTVSYRSTIEIIQVANAIIKPWSDGKITLSKPILRNGKKPSLHIFENSIEQVNALPSLVKLLRKVGHSKIAIITKTTKWNSDITRILRGAGIQSKAVERPNQFHSQDSQDEDIILIDAALSKGLEFDATIVFDVSCNIYDDSEFDRKLLYVGCTRALHEMYLTCTVPSTLLNDIEGNLINPID